MSYQGAYLLCRKCGASVLSGTNGRLLKPEAYSETDITVLPQRAETERQLTLLDADVANVEASLVELVRTLAIVRQRREELERSKNRYRALLPPIRCLPTELLSEIFLFTVADSWNGDIIGKLKFGWVCSQWRLVVAQTSQLWNDIPHGLEHHPELVPSVWLPRSGNAPLTFDVTLEDGRRRIRRSVLRAFLAASSRWQDASFRTTADFIVLPKSPLPLPAPERLTLHVDWPSEHEDDALTAFRDSEALRSVQLHNVTFTMVILPWHRLHTLHIKTATQQSPVKQFLHYLTACPLLTWLSAMAFYDGQIELPYEPQHHPLLETLDLDVDHKGAGDDRNALSYIFNHLTLPKLSIFNLDCFSSMLWHGTAFIAFLSRSGCRLQSLSLSGVVIDVHTLIETLSTMPTIEYLCLMDVLKGNGEPFFTRLTYTDDVATDHKGPSSCILPRMREFSLNTWNWNVEGADLFDADALIAMIWSRISPEGAHVKRHPHPETTRVHLEKSSLGHDQRQDAIKAEMVRWTEAGLRVN